jgi:hypothetical protein
MAYSGTALLYCFTLYMWLHVEAITLNERLIYMLIIINRGDTGSDEPCPSEQPPLAVFPDCTRRYWVDIWSAHRIRQLHFQLSKPDRYLFIQVTTQCIRSRGWRALNRMCLESDYIPPMKRILCAFCYHSSQSWLSVLLFWASAVN